MSDETLPDINECQGMKRYTPVVDWKQNGPRACFGYDPNGKAVLYCEAQAKIDLCMAARRELQERLEARDAEIDRLTEACKRKDKHIQSLLYACYIADVTGLSIDNARAALSQGDK